MSLADRIAALTGTDTMWERPGPTRTERRADIILAVALALDAMLFLELVRSFADFSKAPPLWVQYLTILTLAAPLAVRRRYPLTVGLYVVAHMVVAGIWVAEVSYQVPLQVGYFLAFFTVLAWGRDRRMALLVFAAVSLTIYLWLAGSYAVGTGLDEIRRSLQGESTPQGLFPPITAAVIHTALINTFYIVGAAAWGLEAWHAARNKDLIRSQHAQLEAQAGSLRDQAVVEERLRIARELHDVVAHHVSVMGVQAGAARRVLAKDPDAAAVALTAVETSSRQAVGEMRALLGTLRGATEDALPGEASREPQPTLAELPALVGTFTDDTFEATLSLVEDVPGAAASVPMPVALVLYRAVQEALANVRRHSSATSASVTARIGREPGGRRFGEVEVLDDGRALGGTTGTGLGLLGMRERIASAGGQVEVGPRATGGYRVRVRVPLPDHAG